MDDNYPSPPAYKREPHFFSSQEAFLSNHANDSLALSSYLKLRQENRASPHPSPHPLQQPMQKLSGHKEPFEDFRFEDNGSYEEPLAEPSSPGNQSLIFTENLTEVSELDFKAMRLLVHTSLHEKEQANAKLSLLEDEVVQLMKTTDRYRSDGNWRLPLAIIRYDLVTHFSRKQRLFNVWKNKVMLYHRKKFTTEKVKFTLLVARRNILKVRLLHLSRAFNHWNLQDKYAREAVESYGAKTADRHHRFLLQTVFKVMKSRRMQKHTLRRLNRIARVVLFRKCLAHWKHCVSEYYRFHFRQLKQATTLSVAIQSVAGRRQSTQQAFARWSRTARADQLRSKLSQLANRRFDDLLGKYINPVHQAFSQWKQLTGSVYSNLTLAATVWTDAHRKCSRFLVRKALLTWKTKCDHFRAMTHRIALYFGKQGTQAMRDAFNRLAAAQQEHLRWQVKLGVDRWMRQFLRTVDTSNELNCRNVLSARFRHWHHATHAERHTTQFKGQLRELHGSLQRTKSNLQQEMDHKKELQQKNQQTELHYRGRLVSSKLHFMGKIVANMQHAGLMKGFRQWLQFYHSHKQEDLLCTMELAERTKRVHGTLLRWFKRVGEMNLQIALQMWKFHCRRKTNLNSLRKRCQTSVLRSIFQRWKKAAHKQKLQKWVLTRLSRDKRNALAHLAWDTWARKVTLLKNKCESVLRLVNAKASNQSRLAFGLWRKGITDETLRWERNNRQRKEEDERMLTLRLYWCQFQFGITQQRAENRYVIQLVVSKLMSRMRDGFDRWYQSAKRLTRLRNVYVNLTRVYAHTLGKLHLLCFAKWKAVVWDYQKISYQDIQKKLADAHERIVTITEQQVSLETSASHLRAHNERADHIARTLYHQVHRMLTSRRLYGMVKLTFNCWKQNHELMRSLKNRLKQYFIRANANTATLQLASAFRTWVVAIHVTVREEHASKLKQQNAEHLVLRRTFDRWQTFRSLQRMQMMSVIMRLGSGIQARVAKTLAAGFRTWKTEVRGYLAYRASTLQSCFDKWRVEVVDGSRKRKVIYRLFPKLNIASVRQYFSKWVENTRILRLLCDTIVRMLEVSKLNQTYVSSVRLRNCWQRWCGIVSLWSNQIKACRMIVQCYRKILRTAMFAWRRNCDQQHSTAQARRMTMKKLLQLARFHALNRFHTWKNTTQQMKVAEEHVNKLGLVLKRLRLLRKKRRTWTAWKCLFKELNSPITSTGATLKIHGPKYVNAITRSQYWSSSLLRCVLLSTSLEPVLQLVLEAFSSMVPQFVPSVYYLHHQQQYLWGCTAQSTSTTPGTSFARTNRSHSAHPSQSSPMSLHHTTTALKQLQLSRRFSPIPHQEGPHLGNKDVPTDREYFPAGREHHQHHNAMETPYRVPSFEPVTVTSPGLHQSNRGGGTSRIHTHSDDFHDTPFVLGNSPVAPSMLHARHDGTTILLGEGLVGRCAQQRCMQVYRQGVVTDGTYTQGRIYCSMNVPVPEHSFNINVTPTSAEAKDLVATAVLPIVWGGNVVAVVQLSAPGIDPLGVYFNSNELGPNQQEADGSRTTLEAKNKAIKHMSAVLRDLVDFSDVNSDTDFAASFSVDTGTGAGTHQQTVLSRARTLRGQMMYQLLQLCIELKLNEEQSVGFMSLISTVAEVFGRHFPAVQPSPPDASPNFADTARTRFSSLARSPWKEDVSTLPLQPSNLNTSFVGLAHLFSQTSSELHRADALQHSLLQETESLNQIIEKLKKSRSKYLQKAEALESELATSLVSLEAERSNNRTLSHTVKRAEAKLKAYEQQQAEIGKLNKIMRSAAHTVLHEK